MFLLLQTKEERLFKLAGIIAPMLIAGGGLLALKSMGGMITKPKSMGVPRIDTEYPLSGVGIDKGQYFRQDDTVYHNDNKWTPMRSYLSTFDKDELKSLKDLGHLKYHHVYDNKAARTISDDLFSKMKVNSIIDDTAKIRTKR